MQRFEHSVATLARPRKGPENLLFVGAIGPETNCAYNRRPVGVKSQRLAGRFHERAFGAQRQDGPDRHRRARSAALAEYGTNLRFPANARISRRGLRRNPCEQGQQGKENPVHYREHIGIASIAVQYPRAMVDLCLTSCCMAGRKGHSR